MRAGLSVRLMQTAHKRKEADMWWSYRPYVSVAQRRKNALREVKKLAAAGKPISPITLAGRKIAATFWGNGWCNHLESFGDYASRLPRGRTYVRNGSVVDLQISPGEITALVSGSELYRVKIKIEPLAPNHWKQIRSDCRGQIGSLVELLQGKLSKSVMEIVARRSGGLFPAPGEIRMSCSCPDYAGMCKHIAATLYGVGSRLDVQPELLFELRAVDHLDLIAAAADPIGQGKPTTGRTLAGQDVADIFGIQFADTPANDAAADRIESPYPGHAPIGAIMPAKAKKEPWERPNPRKKSTKLTPESKKEAKASAKKAGGHYPNLVDNMRAAAKQKRSKKSSSAK